MAVVTVFADVSCPFAYVGLTRVSSILDQWDPPLALRVRAWPLELVNDGPLLGSAIAPKVEALRRQIAPDLFGGFRPDRFPTTCLPALAAEAAAHRLGPEPGLRCSLALRRAIFEAGIDIGDRIALARVLDRSDLPHAQADDEAAVLADHGEGRRLGVQGSPHFYTPAGDFFCPTLDIQHDDGGYDIRFDADGFDRFVAALPGRIQR